VRLGGGDDETRGSSYSGYQAKAAMLLRSYSLMLLRSYSLCGVSEISSIRNEKKRQMNIKLLITRKIVFHNFIMSRRISWLNDGIGGMNRIVEILYVGEQIIFRTWLAYRIATRF
jgi:hypothetical protein